MNHKTHPNWLVVILLIALLLAGFYLEANADLSRAGHILAEIGLLLLLYGAVNAWLTANEAAMLAEDLAKYHVMSGQDTTQPARTRKVAVDTVNPPAAASRPGQPASGRAGWSAAAWVSAAWCFLAAQLHRFFWFE